MSTLYTLIRINIYNMYGRVYIHTNICMYECASIGMKNEKYIN